MVDECIAAPERVRKTSPAVSSFLIHDGRASRIRRARAALMDRVVEKGDAIELADALAVVEWHSPDAVLCIFDLLDSGHLVTDFRSEEDKTIVLRRLA